MCSRRVLSLFCVCLWRGEFFTAVGVKNVARRYRKPRATKYISTGNEIYNDGQRILRRCPSFFLLLLWRIRWPSSNLRHADFSSSSTRQNRVAGPCWTTARLETQTNSSDKLVIAFARQSRGGYDRLEVTSASYFWISPMKDSPTATPCRRQNMSQTAPQGRLLASSCKASRSKPLPSSS